MNEHRTRPRPLAAVPATATALANAPSAGSNLFALHRALDHLGLDYGDWAVASGLVERHDEADEHLEHVAEAVEVAATTTGLAHVTHWRTSDVQAVIADQRDAPVWSARAVLGALSDFLRYLEETGQWPGSPGELRRCARELTLARRALELVPARHARPVAASSTPA